MNIREMTFTVLTLVTFSVFMTTAAHAQREPETQLTLDESLLGTFERIDECDYLQSYRPPWSRAPQLQIKLTETENAPALYISSLDEVYPGWRYWEQIELTQGRKMKLNRGGGISPLSHSLIGSQIAVQDRETKTITSLFTENADSAKLDAKMKTVLSHGVFGHTIYKQITLELQSDSLIVTETIGRKTRSDEQTVSQCRYKKMDANSKP